MAIISIRSVIMPGRNSESTYRFGFNGKGNLDKVKGVVKLEDYGMRFYDPRLGMFLSVDPLREDTLVVIN